MAGRCLLAIVVPCIGACASTSAEHPTSPWLAKVIAVNEIKTEAQARAVLADVPQARAEENWLAYDRELGCQKKFLMTPCLDESRRQQRETLRRIHEKEVMANSWLRDAQDRAYAAKRAEQIRLADELAAREATERAEKQREYQQKQKEAVRKETQAALDASQEPQRTAAEAKRREQKEASRLRSPEQLAAEQAQRDANARAYAQKQAEAAKQQAEVRKKQQERALEEQKQLDAQKQGQPATR
jgi:hypothetical protein